MDSLPARIREAMARDGLSLRELGRRSGIHHSLLSRLLRGQLSPSPRLIGRLAGVVGLDLAVPRSQGAWALLSLQELVAGLGLGQELTEAALAQRLASLEKDAKTAQGERTIREAFPVKRRATGLSGPLLDRLDEMYVLHAERRLDPALRAEVGAALLYFVCTRDCIPDDQFPLGYLDDALVIQRVWARLPPGTPGG